MPETLVRYPVIIEPSPYGDALYKAHCPDFEETEAEATTMEEVLEMVTSLINYQVGMTFLKDRDALLPIPSTLWELKGDDLNGKGRCYGWAEINPFALKMQIRTAELNAEAASNSQQRILNSVENIEQAAFLGTWLGGMAFFRK